MKKISFMCTAFRDGIQSAYGARIPSQDLLPIIQLAYDAGIHHLEVGGGALFQSPIFYTNENPFDIMDKIRSTVGSSANLQTLSRGISVVALESQGRDIIDLHAHLFKKHGMTTIRNFDALNDLDNLFYPAQSIHNAGLKHELCITMMSPPIGSSNRHVHNPDFYENILKSMINSGIPYDSICFKDAAGTSTPSVIYETIKRSRRMLGPTTTISFHSHDTVGTCIAQYIAAIEAGANQVDLSLAPVSGGTCQSDLLSMYHALRHSSYTLDIDPMKILQVEQHFAETMEKYFFPPEAKEINLMIPFSPLPGGALTANTQMLRDNHLLHKYNDIVSAMSETIAKGGFGTSVTPVSQFYFQQAFNNVMYKPWSKISEGYGKMVLGYFGKTPVPADPAIVVLAAEQLQSEPTTQSVLHLNDSNPALTKISYIKQLQEENIAITDENIFILATCGAKGLLFLQGKAQVNVRYKQQNTSQDMHNDIESNTMIIELDNELFQITISGQKAEINGTSYNFHIKDNPSSSSTISSDHSHSKVEIRAPLPGMILKIIEPIGRKVRAGEVILIMEAMKMESPIKAPKDGTICQMNVSQAEQVSVGDLLFVIEENVSS
ncbi:biotin attachment protein [Entomospira nematocerorum]|nr:biotin/lipoyl-containing protein [Entomospira nematocera]WDI33683.1 biotin attachment protein [Entomospira nematocera]